MWYIYVLLCSDNSLYTGSTNDIEKRFISHANGVGGKYTRSHKPLRVIHTEKFATKSKALKREIEIKSWVRGRKIKNLNLVLEK